MWFNGLNRPTLLIWRNTSFIQHIARQNFPFVLSCIKFSFCGAVHPVLALILPLFSQRGGQPSPMPHWRVGCKAKFTTIPRYCRVQSCLDIFREKDASFYLLALSSLEDMKVAIERSRNNMRCSTRWVLLDINVSCWWYLTRFFPWKPFPLGVKFNAGQHYYRTISLLILLIIIHIIHTTLIILMRITWIWKIIELDVNRRPFWQISHQLLLRTQVWDLLVKAWES